MVRRLEQLAERGPSRKKNEFNDLGDGLYEAKTRGGSRVAFFYDGRQIVICALGFGKSSRKTPKRKLKTAKERKTAYFSHKQSGTGFRILLAHGMDEPRRQP
jgi:phage-related protein